MNNSQHQLILHCKNQKTASVFHVPFKIYENDFSLRWLHAVEKEIKLGKAIYNNGSFLGQLFYNPDDIIQKINRCIDTINKHHDRLWIDRKAHKNMSHKYLMQIHDDFERLAPHPCFSSEIDDPDYRARLQFTLLDLNDFIHKYEQFYIQSDPSHFHIDLTFVSPERYEFEDCDYKLFSANWKWGELYVAYGITGVPTFNGAIVDDQQTPLPQYHYSSGLYAHFEGEQLIKDYSKFEKSLNANYGMTLKNPYAAFGLIPVGKLNLETTPHKFADSMKSHNYVERLEVQWHRSTPPKTKPLVPYELKVTKRRARKKISCWEIKDHLFLDTSIDWLVSDDIAPWPIKFHFYNSPAGQEFSNWYSNNLNAFPQTELSSQVLGKDQVLWTCPLPKKGPKPLNFKDELTRDRYWGEVYIEWKTKDSPPQLVFYFGLDQVLSKNSELIQEVKKKGCNITSEKEPFTMLPVAALKEPSNSTRRSLIAILKNLNSKIKNPLKKNSQMDHHQLKLKVNKDIQSHSLNGLALNDTDPLFEQWMMVGICEEVLPQWLSVAIIYDEKSDRSYKSAHLVSAASLYPLKFDLVSSKDLDQWKKEKAGSGAKMTVTFPSGIYACRIVSFVNHFIQLLPELNQQKEGFSIPLYNNQKRNNHGPLDSISAELIQPVAGLTPKSGRDSLGKALLAEILFSPPDEPKAKSSKKVSKLIDDFLSQQKSKVFVFNNEPLYGPKFKDFKPDIFLSVASGLKSRTLFSQYCENKIETEIHLVDFSRNSLRYQKDLINCTSMEQLENQLSKALKKYNPGIEDSHRVAKDSLNHFLQEGFKGDFDGFQRVNNLFSEAQLHHLDFLSDPESLVELIPKNKSCFCWHSNAWTTQATLFLMPPKKLRENYVQLAKKIMTRCQLMGWIHKFDFEFVLGNSFDEPKVIFSSGYGPYTRQQHEYDLI